MRSRLATGIAAFLLAPGVSVRNGAVSIGLPGFVDDLAVHVYGEGRGSSRRQ